MSEAKKIGFIAIGSYEQHGGILPFETDSLIANYFANKLKDKYNALLLPSVNYSLSLEHINFNGTVTLSVDTMILYLQDLFTSILNAKVIDYLFVINGHGGNKSLLELISTCCNYRNKEKKIVLLDLYSKSVIDKATELFKCFDTHAGSVEASIISAITDSYPDKVIKDTKYIKKISGGLKLFTSDLISETGVISDIDEVEFNMDKGLIIVSAILNSLVSQVEDNVAKIRLINGKS